MTYYAEGVEPPSKFSKRGVLGKISIFRGQVAEKEWMTFSGGNRGRGFGGGWVSNFYIKNKLNSEIFNDKKVNKQKCFSVITGKFPLRI